MDLLEALERADLILAQGSRREPVLLRHRIAEALLEVAPKSHDEVTCHVCIHNRERASLATSA